MLSAKRKLRWERAWVAVGLICAVAVFSNLSSAQNADTGSSNPPAPGAASAPNQNQLPSQPPTPVYTPGQTATAAQSQDAGQNQDGPADPDASGADSTQNNTQPVAKNLETGLPLRTVMSPLHWGHLSLLSFQGFEVYDSNYQPQQAIVGRQLTALQGLFVYSIQKAKSSIDLQYCPYVWFSQNQTYKDFTANALNFSTSHIFNRRWSMTVSDGFMYSPNLANTLQSAFSADYVSNTASQTAFLSAGRKALYNNVDVGINTQISETSHLSFNLVDDYVRLGSYDGTTNTTLPLPTLAESMNYYGGGATLTRQWTPRTSVNVAYDYRRETVFGANAADSVYNSVELGFSRVLKPGLTFSLEAGPAWSEAAPPQNGPLVRQMTAQGSAQIYKVLGKGGLALSFYRDSEYSGVVSNSYNNRYDVSFNHDLFRRWNFLVSGSYIQQEFVGRPLSTGEVGWAQLGYMLTRNWSVFSGYRYLNLTRNQAWSGPQQLVALGIRWAWQPRSARR